MSIINIEGLNIFSSQFWAKIKQKMNGYLNKNEDSVVIGKVTFKEAYILGAKVSSIDNTGATNSMINDTSFFTCHALRIPADTKINKITIGVHNSKNIGDVITGVNIGFLSDSSRNVLKYSIIGGTAIVHKNTDTAISCEKAITVMLNETFDEDVLPMVGGNGAAWGARIWPHGGLAFGSGTLPEVGNHVSLNSGNWIGEAMVYASDLSINELFERINQITPPTPTVNIQEYKEG